jgi:hypothetical protein
MEATTNENTEKVVKTENLSFNEANELLEIFNETMVEPYGHVREHMQDDNCLSYL